MIFVPDGSIVTAIKLLNPCPQDSIVLSVKMYEVPYLDIVRLYNDIVSLFPENKVIFIPDGASLSTVNKDVLKQVRQNISDVIGERGMCDGEDNNG